MMNERTIMILMSIFTVGFAGITAFSYMTGDHTAPEISFPQTEITYTEGSDTAKLLEGVSAVDDKNGDVTQYVCIDNIIPNPEDGTAAVIYAAYDFSNNVAKARRTVQYIPAADESSDSDTEVQNGSGTEEAGTQDNDTENTADVADNEPVQEQPVDPKAPVLTMAEHAFTIEEGGPFTPKNRVLRVEDDVDNSDYLMRHLNVDGDYDINTAGVYELDYYVVDSEGRESNHEKMVLTVEKAGQGAQGNTGVAGADNTGNANGADEAQQPAAQGNAQDQGAATGAQQ